MQEGVRKGYVQEGVRKDCVQEGVRKGSHPWLGCHGRVLGRKGAREGRERERRR